MRRAVILALGSFLFAACSSTAEPAPGGGAGGSGGSSGGNATGGGGMSTGSGGAGVGGSGTGGEDTGDGSSPEATTGSGGEGGAPPDDAGETGGSTPTDGGAGGSMSAKDFTCNTVLGIHTTEEWFTTGKFESHVDDARWQIIANHPGYVENWAVATDPIWSTKAVSPCAMNSDNPDRVIYNAFSDPADATYTNSDAWVAGLTKVIENLTKKYSRLKRIDLLTMTRAPNNTPCVAGNRQSIVEVWVDDAIAKVVAAHPGLVTAAPKFTAPDCTVYTNGGPHFTAAGMITIANLYGDYYSKEP